MKKLLIQCDFDGTILEEDISYAILEQFGQDNWQKFNNEYNAGKLKVSEFNEKTFGLVKAGYDEQMKFVRGKEQTKPGFLELVALCRQEKIRFVIVSNGFDYYIDHVICKLGINDLEYHAGKVTFNDGGMQVNYFSPKGELLTTGFKDSYTDKYLAEGYEIIYIGDGVSDLTPAKKCHTVFACASLAEKCDEAAVPFLPFHDFYDVITYLLTRSGR